MGIKTEKHILSESDFLWVCDTLRKQLHYGVSIINGISHMSKTSPSRIHPILNQIKYNLLQGQSFATALFIHIPHSAPYRLTTTKIDNPIRLLKGLATYYRNKYEKRNELIKTLRYPALLLFIMVGIGIMLVTIILPQQHQLIQQINPSAPTFFYSPWRGWTILGCFSLFITYIYRSVYSRIDPASIGHLFMSLGGLLSIGVPLKTALIAIDTTPHKKLSFQLFKHDFFKNPQLTYCIERHFSISALTRNTLSHIENLPQPGKHLYALGYDILDRRHTRTLQSIRLIQPLILISIALIIVWVANLLFMPMITMINTLHI
jgi:type II secretory pathway component PulF